MKKYDYVLVGSGLFSGVVIKYVNGIGKRNAANITNGINFFRFSFKNSHFTSLSNSLASRHTLEVIFKTFFTSMRF